MTSSRLSPLARICLVAFGSLVLAVNLAHWILPDRSGLTPMHWPISWIEPAEPGKQAYFRTTIDLPFNPTWAWIAVSAEDYDLYVNNKLSATNSYTDDDTYALLHKIKDVAQSLTPFAPAVAYKPELRRASNEEWRFPIHEQIAPFLHPGRNVISISTKSPNGARIAVRGEIIADGQRIEISGNAADWQATPLFDRQGTATWHEPTVDFLWPKARTGSPLENPVYAPAPPAIWEQPMPLQALTGQTSGGELKFGLVVPGAGPAQQKPSWIRLYSNWTYYLFMGDQFVGSGGGAGPAEAWDLTAFQSATPRRIGVRLVRQNDPLAPPVETSPIPSIAIDGNIGGRDISTDSGWQHAEGTAPNWLTSAGTDWQPASLMPLNQPIPSVSFQLPAELGQFWFGRFVILWLASAAGILILYQVLATVQRLFRVPARIAHGSSVWVLSLVLLGLVLAEWLQLRFFTTDSLLAFLKPENRLPIQVVAPTLLLATLTAYASVSPRALSGSGRFLKRHMPTLALIAIIGLTIAMRLYRIGFEDLQDDENVSWDAARGIIREGLPIETSGIFYTRSALYHYVLAGWLIVFGDTKAAARAFSIVPGVVSVWFTYRVTLRMAGGRSVVALLAALVIAIDPWELRNSQDIRFYQQVQAANLVAMEAFFLGFIDRRGKFYQNLFFLCVVVGCFSQEVFVLTFPGYCMAALYFYRPWRWRDSINICVGFVTSLGLVLYDIGIFEVMTLTANVGISSSSAPALMLHVWNPTVLPASFFLNYLQRGMMFSIPFFAGLIYWLTKPNRYVAAVYLQVIFGLAAATILVVQIENRYTYIFFPFLIIIAMVTVDSMLQDLARKLSAYAGSWREPLRARWLGFAGALCAASLLVAMEPWKTWQAYGRQINTEQESGFWYVADHKRPGDIILANTPDAAATVTRGLDKYVSNIIFFDALYQHKNEIVERWAGGDFVSTLDMLRDVLITHDRVWMVMSGSLSRSYPPDWKDVIDAAQTKYEWWGGRVLLWERKAGSLPLTSEGGSEIDSY